MAEEKEIVLLGNVTVSQEVAEALAGFVDFLGKWRLRGNGMCRPLRGETSMNVV